MKPRHCVATVMVTLAVVLGGGPATGQDFPAKPVRLVVPFAPGGTLDIIARALAPPMSRALGQSVVVENRPGGGTVVGTELVARAPADGHTLLVMAPSFTVNPAVRSNLSYDTLRDFAGVTRIASTPLLFAVHPSVPARTLKELVALARARPGQLTYASSSPVGEQRLAMERFKAMARIDVLHVPYSGGSQSMTAVMGGHVGILLGNVSTNVPQVAAGKLRALAVTSLERSAALKDVPTVAESGFPGYEAINWFGAVVPGATPKHAIARLNAEIVRALRLPEVRDGLQKLGLSPAAMTPEEFDSFIRAEMAKNEKIVREANIKVN